MCLRWHGNGADHEYRTYGNKKRHSVLRRLRPYRDRGELRNTRIRLFAERNQKPRQRT